MPPFWAQKRDEPGSVLLEDYAVDPDQKRPVSSKRPLFPAGAPEKARTQTRNTLPAAIVKTDPRKERDFSNRRQWRLFFKGGRPLVVTQVALVVSN
ncbi:unnamed protein product [Durusdinium trenchii]|uniref:Uncharacterized protein n=1 Tax=Durusdinium trenchii TaxID=1381693 RepID=A0ABP0N746_9DINO